MYLYSCTSTHFQPQNHLITLYGTDNVFSIFYFCEFVFLGQNKSIEHACQYIKDVICRDLDAANAFKVAYILFVPQIGKNNIEKTMAFHKRIYYDT